MQIAAEQKIPIKEGIENSIRKDGRYKGENGSNKSKQVKQHNGQKKK